MCHTYTYIVKYLHRTLIASTLIILFFEILKFSHTFFVKENLMNFQEFVFETKISKLINYLFNRHVSKLPRVL
jgi:hypothetical protein